ncbi:MAG TPA: helix-turn-helix domain-containing protein [Ktedonobacteraceae bacterium]|nr:helix-turn-helix domain-containing protein [Ktedonobacteraceae bacterium]
MQEPLPQQEQVPHVLFIHLNEHGQLRVKTRLLLTASEIAEFLRTSRQKAYWLLYRREIPSVHIGSRRFASLDALEHYIREREIEEQQDLLSFLEGYYRYYPFFHREPHPEVKQAQERLNAMQELQGQAPPKGQERVHIEAALYHITITEAGRLECTPRWLLSVSEAAELLGISRTSLYKLAKEGDFPMFHLNRRQYVRAESLLDWIRAKEHPERVPSVPMTAAQKRKKSPKTETKNRRKI